MTFLMATVLATGFVQAQEKERSGTPLVVGLDHIPVAVADLDVAAKRYRQLGFTLKPGRFHENGIRNRHIKFPDGSEIELITAVESSDDLTSEYRKHLERGDGPAFVALFAPDLNGVAQQLDAMGRVYDRHDGLLAFPEADGLRYLFFGQRNHSPTDRPEHFQHDNGAKRLIGVWIAEEDPSAERQLLMSLGATISVEEVFTPDAAKVPVARLPQGEVVFLPGSAQLVEGRRIVGATICMRDLLAFRRQLENVSWDIPPVVKAKDGHSMFFPPDITHGFWLEFRELAPADHGLMR